MSAQMGNLKKERKIYFSVIGGLIMPNSLERVFLVKTLTSTSNKNLTRALQFQNLALNIIVFFVSFRLHWMSGLEQMLCT